MNKKMIGAAGVLLLALVVYSAFNPEESSLFPRCPFLVLTGFKCPGCGSQRAIHSLLHLDVVRAAHYNFLLVASLPLVFALLYAEFVRTRKPALYARLNNVKLIWVYFAIVVFWWIGRNIWNW